MREQNKGRRENRSEWWVDGRAASPSSGDSSRGESRPPSPGRQPFGHARALARRLRVTLALRSSRPLRTDRGSRSRRPSTVLAHRAPPATAIAAPAYTAAGAQSGGHALRSEPSRAAAGLVGLRGTLPVRRGSARSRHPLQGALRRHTIDLGLSTTTSLAHGTATFWGVVIEGRSPQSDPLRSATHRPRADISPASHAETLLVLRSCGQLDVVHVQARRDSKRGALSTGSDSQAMYEETPAVNGAALYEFTR